MNLVDSKKATGMTCPATPYACGKEISVSDLQKLLRAEEFEQYLQATLLAFIEQDSLTMICPKPSCKVAISISDQNEVVVPHEIKERDEEGKVLSREAYIHFMKYRVRCRDCSTIFCADCKQIPYHKGFTCASWKDYQKARHCRFCASKLSAENTAKFPLPGLRDVCTSDECAVKAALSCGQLLECGCPCNGVRDEKQHLACLKHVLAIGEDYCAICYVEDLNSAPCIQSKGCKHVLHIACVKTRLEAKWPGARISFEFRCCPQCKQPIHHPALAATIDPIDTLQKEVESKALERLAYEGRPKRLLSLILMESFITILLDLR